MEDREAAYVELAKLYAAGTGDDRRAIISGWDFGAEWKLPNGKRLACATGERYPPQDRIAARLLFGAIASATRFVCEPNTDRAQYELAKSAGMRMVDYRDELVGLAIEYQSAVAAGLDAEGMFRTAAAISPKPVAQFIDAFAARPEGLKSLSAFLLARVVNADGEIEIHIRGFGPPPLRRRAQ
jgi:hypothetical protein